MTFNEIFIRTYFKNARLLYYFITSLNVRFSDVIKYNTSITCQIYFKLDEIK